MRKLIRDEVKRQLQLVTSGSSGTNTAIITEDIQALFPGVPTITQRPVMRPYGFVSRAPANTLQVNIQQGEHPGNRMVIGHRDAAPPTTVQSGESMVYSVGGFQVYIANGTIQCGKNGVFETVVAGDTLTTFLTALLNSIISHTHIGNLGAPTGPPQNASDFTSELNNYVANGKILIKTGGRF
jgi:phage gp45-like